MTRDQIVQILRAEIAESPDATCLVLPVWTAEILQTDQMDGIPLIYDDISQYIDGIIH